VNSRNVAIWAFHPKSTYPAILEARNPSGYRQGSKTKLLAEILFGCRTLPLDKTRLGVSDFFEHAVWNPVDDARAEQWRRASLREAKLNVTVVDFSGNWKDSQQEEALFTHGLMQFGSEAIKSMN
jgi:hypothetical protein